MVGRGVSSPPCPLATQRPVARAHTDLEQPGQAKVSHLAGQVVTHEQVLGGQAPVHDALLLQVAQALGHLAGKGQQEGRAQGLAFGACSWG